MKTLDRSRSHRTEHVDTEGSWAISYGDMITLLLSFFVLYFTVDHEKVRANQLQQSLLMRLQESGVEGDLAHRTVLNIGKEDGDNIDKRVLANLGARVHSIGSQVVIDFEKVSFFKLGKVEVNEEGRKVLEDFARVFTPFAGSYDLGIRAFTDTRPVRAQRHRYEDNLELSALRSVAAMRVLQRAGIPLASMKLAGFGEMKLMDEIIESRTPASKDALALARKIVLVIEPKRG